MLPEAGSGPAQTSVESRFHAGSNHCRTLRTRQDGRAVGTALLPALLPALLMLQA
ncbi:hypothetical protein ACFYQA_23585 [Streptomyces sp. NPDC005774]|uniref:hypothetical protein n=1 Tax=Streptomyces sp. NPDC005774 TaxID=3364728 RepID=UPI0036C8B859